MVCVLILLMPTDCDVNQKSEPIWVLLIQSAHCDGREKFWKRQAVTKSAVPAGMAVLPSSLGGKYRPRRSSPAASEATKTVLDREEGRRRKRRRGSSFLLTQSIFRNDWYCHAVGSLWKKPFGLQSRSLMILKAEIVYKMPIILNNDDNIVLYYEFCKMMKYFDQRTTFGPFLYFAFFSFGASRCKSMWKALLLRPSLWKCSHPPLPLLMHTGPD